jgi:DNA-binding NarL/FixJ family response regulator
MAVGRTRDATRRVITSSTRPAIPLGRIQLVSALPVIEGIVRAAATSIDPSIVVVNGGLTETCSALDDHGNAIIVIDLDRAFERGRGFLRLIHERYPAARPVILSSREDGALVLDALKRGARAFVRAPDGFPDLPDVLTRVAAGERFVAAELEPSLLLELPSFVRRTREGSEMDYVITRRQQQVLELLADGFTNLQIARRLAISPRTVETHVTNVYRKLSARSRLQAIARAAVLGVIELR